MAGVLGFAVLLRGEQAQVEYTADGVADDGSDAGADVLGGGPGDDPAVADGDLDLGVEVGGVDPVGGGDPDAKLCCSCQTIREMKARDPMTPAAEAALREILGCVIPIYKGPEPGTIIMDISEEEP